VSGRLPRWARDLADTDDLVQDTLLRTFTKIEDFEVRGPGALQAYLRQAVLNRVRDELRRKARAPTRLDEDELELEAAGSPLEDAIGREAAERYEAALTRLEMDYTYADQDR
jgi:RNA polymerase sigma factor (sigma-70 family)